jgi:hypothetical protein
MKPGTSMINAETGETHTEKQMLEMIDEISRTLPKGEQVLKEQQARSLRYYKMRNRLFFVGVIGVFVGKVASPLLRIKQFALVPKFHFGTAPCPGS